jgi:hypothetical protein
VANPNSWRPLFITGKISPIRRNRRWLMPKNISAKPTSHDYRQPLPVEIHTHDQTHNSVKIATRPTKISLIHILFPPPHRWFRTYGHCNNRSRWEIWRKDPNRSQKVPHPRTLQQSLSIGAPTAIRDEIWSQIPPNCQDDLQTFTNYSIYIEQISNGDKTQQKPIKTTSQSQKRMRLNIIFSSK